jgi:hypothetical protein
LRRISSISRSYLFGIPVLFLELARTLFVLMIPTSQRRDKGFISQFATRFHCFCLSFYSTRYGLNSRTIQLAENTHESLWRPQKALRQEGVAMCVPLADRLPVRMQCVETLYRSLMIEDRAHRLHA